MKKFRRCLCFEKKISSFLDIHWQISGLLLDFFSAGSSQLLPTCPEESFEEKQFSEIYCFPSFQDSELKRFGLFWKISAGLSKQYLTCPSKHFDENVFLDKVLSFSAFNEKIVAFCRKCFRSVVKTEFSLSMRKLRRSSILWENNSSLSKHWATSLRPLVKKNNWGCQNSILPVHQNLFDENNFLNKALWFSAFKDNFVALCQKFFGPVVKTEFSLSIRKFWRISSLWEKIHHFRTFCDKSSAFCQKN